MIRLLIFSLEEEKRIYYLYLHWRHLISYYFIYL